MNLIIQEDDKNIKEVKITHDNFAVVYIDHQHFGEDEVHKIDNIKIEPLKMLLLSLFHLVSNPILMANEEEWCRYYLPPCEAETYHEKSFPPRIKQFIEIVRSKNTIVGYRFWFVIMDSTLSFDLGLENMFKMNQNANKSKKRKLHHDASYNIYTQITSRKMWIQSVLGTYYHGDKYTFDIAERLLHDSDAITNRALGLHYAIAHCAKSPLIDVIRDEQQNIQRYIDYNHTTVSLY